MRDLFLWFFLCLALSLLFLTIPSIGHAQDTTGNSLPVPRLDESRTTLHPEWKQFFDSLGLDSGCIAIYDEAADHYHVYNPTRVERGYAPASLFKIVLSLEALEHHLIDTTTTLFRWDSVHRGGNELNKDQTVQEAFVNVSTWGFTKLAVRLGKPLLSRAMHRLSYGNADTVGDSNRFWLIGQLKLSALTCIGFNRKLADDLLPGYSLRSQSIVRDMMFRRDTLGITVWRKTGLGWIGDVQIGRLMGWALRGGRRWFFGVNFQISDPGFPTRVARRYLYLSALKSLGVVPEGWEE